MSPLRKLLRGTKMSHRKTHLRSEITGGTRRLVTEPDVLLTKQMRTCRNLFIDCPLPALLKRRRMMLITCFKQILP